MAKEKLSFDAFAAYMPAGAMDKVKVWFEKYQIKLVITRARKSILGNYLHPHQGHPHHAITINGNQNPYSFLVTLLHELAHLETFVQYANKVQAHGVEWQNVYRSIMIDYLGQRIFPDDLERAIDLSLKKVKAGSCSDPKLYKALAAYDEEQTEGLVWVEELVQGNYFVTKEGLVFQMIEKRRTRFLCEQLGTKKRYLFQGVARVKQLSEEELREKGILKL